VRASVHHAVSVYAGQVTASLSEPEVFAWFERQVDSVAARIPRIGPESPIARPVVARLSP